MKKIFLLSFSLIVLGCSKEEIIKEQDDCCNLIVDAVMFQDYRNGIRYFNTVVVTYNACTDTYETMNLETTDETKIPLKGQCL